MDLTAASHAATRAAIQTATHSASHTQGAAAGAAGVAEDSVAGAGVDRCSHFQDTLHNTLQQMMEHTL